MTNDECNVYFFFTIVIEDDNRIMQILLISLKLVIIICLRRFKQLIFENFTFWTLKAVYKPSLTELGVKKTVLI